MIAPCPHSSPRRRPLVAGAIFVVLVLVGCGSEESAGDENAPVTSTTQGSDSDTTVAAPDETESADVDQESAADTADDADDSGSSDGISDSSDQPAPAGFVAHVDDEGRFRLALPEGFVIEDITNDALAEGLEALGDDESAAQLDQAMAAGADTALLALDTTAALGAFPTAITVVVNPGLGVTLELVAATVETSLEAAGMGVESTGATTNGLGDVLLIESRGPTDGFSGVDEEQHNLQMIGTSGDNLITLSYTTFGPLTEEQRSEFEAIVESFEPGDG